MSFEMIGRVEAAHATDIQQLSGSDVLATLGRLDLAGLRDCWRDRFGVPPKVQSTDLMAHMLAFRLQAEEAEGLDVETRRALRRPVGERGKALPISGVTIIREWQGERHEVTALGTAGFEYRGERFRSLTQIARKITGTAWNGPRFFGLRKGEQTL